MIIKTPLRFLLSARNQLTCLIFADISLRGKLVVYDNVNQKIGWAQSACVKPQKIKSLPFFWREFVGHMGKMRYIAYRFGSFLVDIQLTTSAFLWWIPPYLHTILYVYKTSKYISFETNVFFFFPFYDYKL